MKLVFMSGPRSGDEITIEPGRELAIGRDPAAGISVDDPRMSRMHARIRVDANGEAWVEDLGSTNGTLIDGRRIDAPTRVAGGSVVTVGSSGMRITSDIATVVGGATEVIAPPASGRPAGMTVLRSSVARADRTARLAVAAAIVVVVAVVAVGAYLLISRPLSNDDIVQRLRPAVVRIEARTDFSSGSGTGWVYDAEKGLIVTNNHVISGGRDIRVGADGITPRTANIVASAPCDDVAVIHVDDKAGLTTAELGSQADLRQGDDVLVIGYPVTSSAERNLVVTSGTVSIVRTTLEGGGPINNLPNVVLSSARINPGNSGGPLVTRSGRIVGINSILVASRDQNYAIGIDRVKDILPGLAAGRGIAWTGMGFEFPESVADLVDLGLPAEPGLLVQTVEPGTEAADAGFGAFPILVTAIDRVAMDGSLKTYCKVVGGKQNGDSARFAIAFKGADGIVRQEIELHFR